MRLRRVVVSVSLAASAAALMQLPACHASTAVGAATMTALAGGTSAYRRSQGECYIDCLPGTFCNRATGLCDPLDCEGKCGDGYLCEESGTGSACVPREQSQQVILQPRNVPSGAQPYGDGQAVQPSGAAVVSGGASTAAATDLSAKSAPANSDQSISARAGGSSSSNGGGTTTSFASNPSSATNSSASDGGVAKVPASALQFGMPARSKDVPARSNSIGPNLENGWDPSQPAPVPQMDNPNQPPPH